LALRFAFFDPLRQSLERLARQDPGDDLWPWYLSVSHERIGNVLSAQGNLAGALEAYRACLAIRERQAQQQYSGYAVWQRDLSVSQGKIGGLLGGICG
jgi:hypothetical protein